MNIGSGQVRQVGATIVEIMIGLAIIALVMMLAVPSFSAWLQGSQIRTAGESLLGAVQLARGQALASNSRVCVQLLTPGGALSNVGTGWSIAVQQNDPAAVAPDFRLLALNCAVVPPTGNVIASKIGAEGARDITVVSAVPGTALLPTYIVFDGLGNVVDPNQFTPWQLLTIDLANAKGTCVAAGGTLHCLRIEVSPAGNVRMCDPDPAINAGDPRRC